MPTFNILPEDKIKVFKADTKFIKLEVTHCNCEEPFIEIYIHQSKFRGIIMEMEKWC